MAETKKCPNCKAKSIRLTQGGLLRCVSCGIILSYKNAKKFKVDTTIFENKNLNIPFFIIDNVNEYINHNKKIMGIGNIPSIKPPFQEMFVETSSPEYILNTNGKKIKWPKNYGERWGYHVFYSEKNQITRVRLIEYTMLLEKTKIWGVGGYKGKIAIKRSPSWYIKLNKKGVPISSFYKNVHKGSKLKYAKIMPLLYSLALMNCRNVEYIENNHGIIYERKNNDELKYKTLKINPMNPQNKNKFIAGKTNNKNPLHICRGHFKDYRENGLFGKYHDIYWWDSQMRGNKEVGEVKKVYEIETG